MYMNHLSGCYEPIWYDHGKQLTMRALYIYTVCTEYSVQFYKIQATGGTADAASSVNDLYPVGGTRHLKYCTLDPGHSRPFLYQSFPLNTLPAIS